MRSHGKKLISVVITVLIFAPWLLMIPRPAPVRHSVSRPGSTIPLQNLPVFSDFDGDNKLDQAHLSSNGSHKRIAIGLGKSSWRSLSFESGANDAGELLSSDIDSDGDADLIWVSETFPKRLVVWLGDGAGNFSIAVPRPSDFRHFRSMLIDSSESAVVQDVNVRELDGILTGSDSAALIYSGPLAHIVASARLIKANNDFVIRAISVAGHFQRGPPLQFC